MKKQLLLSVLLCTSVFAFSQDISGTWVGLLEIQDFKLDFGFNIEKTDSGYTSTMDIPKQGLSNGKVETTVFIDSTLTLSLPIYQIEYKGRLNSENEFIGTISQAGQPFPMKLTKGSMDLNRPQEPMPPFAYYTEEISFKNTDAGITLHGTLSLPKKDGIFPVALILSGSGPHDRDGAMFGHKPYLVLADQLTKNGIGVLRFDERGVGKSEGTFETTSIEQFEADATAAITFLKTRKEVNPSKIGLIGHSIGGIIAPKMASKRDDINFVVLMAAPGVDGDALMLAQKAASERLAGLNEQQILQARDAVEGAYKILKSTKLSGGALKDTLNTYYINKYGALLPEDQREQLVTQLTSLEIIGIIQAKPSTYLSNITCPVLAINGSKDFQVGAKENLLAIENALPKNEHTKVVELENLNHLFQESNTGGISEYSEIEQTLSPRALGLITEWIKEQTQ